MENDTEGVIEVDSGNHGPPPPEDAPIHPHDIQYAQLQVLRNIETMIAEMHKKIMQIAIPAFLQAGVKKR